MEIKLPNDVELDNVYVDIHCIGRNPQGEGILFIVKTENYIIYSGIIDECVSKEILTQNGIKTLNFICWSHPHDDHVEGLKNLIGQNSKKDTKIIVPMGISDVVKKMTHKCKSTYKEIRSINKWGRENKGEYVEVNQTSILPEERYIDRNGKELKIRIKAIAPISSRINNLRQNRNIDMNTLSICLIISVNDVDFLLTSDIYNNIINDMNINEELLHNVVYYKIPHHGSINSDKLLFYIPKLEEDGIEKNRIAVTTIYKKNGENTTPNREVIDKYKESGLRVFCTSKSYLENVESKCEFGSVSIRIKILEENHGATLDWDYKLVGEADEVLEKVEEGLLFY